MENIKEKIVSSINAVKTQGITLVTEDWGSKSTKCACALGCVLLANNQPVSDDKEINANVVSEILGVTEGWVDSFIQGFDANPILDPEDQTEAFLLGYSIRNETSPIPHADYVSSLDPMVVELMLAMEI